MPYKYRFVTEKFPAPAHRFRLYPGPLVLLVFYFHHFYSKLAFRIFIFIPLYARSSKRPKLWRSPRRMFQIKICYLWL